MVESVGGNDKVEWREVERNSQEVTFVDNDSRVFIEAGFPHFFRGVDTDDMHAQRQEASGEIAGTDTDIEYL